MAAIVIKNSQQFYNFQITIDGMSALVYHWCIVGMRNFIFKKKICQIFILGKNYSVNDSWQLKKNLIHQFVQK